LGKFSLNYGREWHHTTLLSILVTYRNLVITAQVFNSIIEATKFYGFKSKSAICGCCNKRVKSAGKDESTGKKLHWMYYEEYLESTASSEVSA